MTGTKMGMELTWVPAAYAQVVDVVGAGEDGFWGTGQLMSELVVDSLGYRLVTCAILGGCSYP